MRPRLLRAFPAAALFVGAALAPIASAQGWKATDLGRPLPTTITMRVSVINDLGHIGGWLRRSSTESSWTASMLYRDGFFEEYNGSRDATLQAFAGINNAGQATIRTGGFLGYRRDYRERTDTSIPPLAGDAITGGFGINDAGDTVGYSFGSWSEGRGRKAIVFRGGVTQELPNLGEPTWSWAFDINRQGNVIVGQAALPPGAPQAGAIRAVAWVDGAIRELGTLGGTASRAHGVNDLGQIVGWSDTGAGTFHAFLHANGAMTDLGTLGGPNSYALDINNRGQVIGIANRAGDADTFYPFLYENGQMIDLAALPELAALGCERWSTPANVDNVDGDIPNVALNNLGQIAGVCDVGTNTPHLFVLWRDRPYAPERGDLSGDRKADILWANDDGRAAVWQMDGLSPTAMSGILGPGTGWSASHVADLDGDGKSDVVWRHADGRVAAYLMDGTRVVTSAQLTNAGSGWSVVHAGDLDRDGRADLVFRHSDGRIAVWLMDGTTVRSGATLLGAGSGWSVERLADFDGDGGLDLLWVHGDGRVAIWLLDGTAVKASAQLLNAGSGWRPVQAHDLDIDGRADIVWQHADGSVAVWMMRGTSMKSGQGLVGPATGWSVTHTGRGMPGLASIVWRHVDGRVAAWESASWGFGSGRELLGPGTGWRVARLARLDADGSEDILWQHDDGRTAAWLMSSGAMTSGREILGPGTGWRVSPPTP